nr:receptor-like protein 12 [Ipomoea batatas]
MGLLYSHLKLVLIVLSMHSVVVVLSSSSALPETHKRKCSPDVGNPLEPSQGESSETEAMFDWKFAGAGFGFGVVAGLTIGFTFLADMIVQWLVRDKKKSRKNKKISPPDIMLCSEVMCSNGAPTSIWIQLWCNLLLFQLVQKRCKQRPCSIELIASNEQPSFSFYCVQEEPLISICSKVIFVQIARNMSELNPDLCSGFP